MEPDAERIEVGAVSSVNAARRELRVSANAGFGHAFEDLEWIRLAPRKGAEIRCRVASVKPAAGSVLVALAPGVLRETVAGLKGAAVVMQPGELKRVPEEERTLLDAVGFAVVDAAGEPIGTLTDVYSTPAHGILEIGRAGGATVLVPAIEEVIADIQWERERIVVNDLAPYSVDDAD